MTSFAKQRDALITEMTSLFTSMFYRWIKHAVGPIVRLCVAGVGILYLLIEKDCFAISNTNFPFLENSVFPKENVLQSL